MDLSLPGRRRRSERMENGRMDVQRQASAAGEGECEGEGDVSGQARCAPIKDGQSQAMKTTGQTGIKQDLTQ